MSTAKSRKPTGHPGNLRLSKTSAFMRPYRLLAFDWDGTAVSDRSAPAPEAASRIATLSGLGVWSAVITGTKYENLERKFFLLIRPDRRWRVTACMNRGSEVFGFDRAGVCALEYRREATPQENRLMDEIALAVQKELLENHGLETRIVFDRLNRRKLDLIPEPAWADPPKERIGELMNAVNDRLRRGQVQGGIRHVLDRVERLAEQRGITLRLTSDVKHVELGLTDKSDSVHYLIDTLARPRGISADDVAILGDEFGPIDGIEGSDFK
ncbi:MAG: hypothetical protein HY706_05885, partial [Candidatus Hydrogenedentes bacterium]|nr:hypothetical protein [Candidatus Hydrogenedentota bacterium]